MTTLYKPVLIESAEQAEALPIGTYAKNEETTGSGTWFAPPRVNIGRGMWSGDDLYRSSDMVGWTALVPIEAEETRVRGFATLDNGDITVTVKTGLPPRKIRIGDGLIVAPGTPWEGA